MIHVGSNTESQLEEILCKKERKWIWYSGSIITYGINKNDGSYCLKKGVEIVRLVTG